MDQVLAPKMHQTAVRKDPAQIAGQTDSPIAQRVSLKFCVAKFFVAPITGRDVGAAPDNLTDPIECDLGTLFVDQKDIFARGRITDRNYVCGDLGLFVDKVETQKSRFTAA